MGEVPGALEISGMRSGLTVFPMAIWPFLPLSRKLGGPEQRKAGPAWKNILECILHGQDQLTVKSYPVPPPPAPLKKQVKERKVVRSMIKSAGDTGINPRDPGTGNKVRVGKDAHEKCRF